MTTRIVEMFLFDTCTHKCAYCHFAESGKVLDGSQIKPYRDPAFIDNIVNFFNRRTTAADKWLVTLTGGEPLLMPNLGRFVDSLAASGNKVAYYSALLVGEKHPNYCYLLESARHTDYIMASFHPEAEAIEDPFFGRLKQLKRAGHNVILRFVGHPARLHRLDELAARCRDLDIAIHATTLFSPEYPAAYTAEEKATILRHATSLSQIIQIEGGLDTAATRCTAGLALIAIDMRTGKITPCISVQFPVIGNIYEDRLGCARFTCPPTISKTPGIIFAGSPARSQLSLMRRTSLPGAVAIVISTWRAPVLRHQRLEVCAGAEHADAVDLAADL